MASDLMTADALDLFLAQPRFDLIFKYLYAKHRTDHFKEMYLKSTEVFINFKEYERGVLVKSTPDDFMRAFDEIIEKVQNDKFDFNSYPIPISEKGMILNGAHRLSAAAAFGKEVLVQKQPNKLGIWNYMWFLSRGLPLEFADEAARNYTEIDKNSRIFTIPNVQKARVYSHFSIFQESSLGTLLYEKTTSNSRTAFLIHPCVSCSQIGHETGLELLADTSIQTIASAQEIFS